jgi:DNA-directed RNA polymerase specialized sigma24 family protein
MAVRNQSDVSAYSEFVTARSARLFRTAYLVIGDYQLAQDLLQDALVRTYVAWPRLREVANAEAYTRRTIVTTAISWRRRRSFHERWPEGRGYGDILTCRLSTGRCDLTVRGREVSADNQVRVVPHLGLPG